MPETTRSRWFPEMPPALPGESDDAYTDRLTGADGTGRVPYDHRRNRQCSLGYHDECSDPAGESCECPCHTAAGRAEMRARDLEESVVALWALASVAHLEPVPTRENVLRGDTIPAANAAKTKCINGHNFDEANTYWRPDGKRDCRTCRREADRRSIARKKAAA